LGKKSNPYPYIKQADYFCLFSYYEGYGMAIEEAKILNRRILITDTAAKECIEDYNKAQVFENSEDGIYEGLKQVILKKKTEKDFSDQKNWQEYYEQILEKVISIIKCYLTTRCIVCLMKICRTIYQKQYKHKSNGG